MPQVKDALQNGTAQFIEKIELVYSVVTYMSTLRILEQFGELIRTIPLTLEATYNGMYLYVALEQVDRKISTSIC